LESLNKISAVIITFNEEKNIERCLLSLIGVADEIIVVDSYSTDKTEEICSKYAVRFIKNPFEGHIQQKNYAMNQASYSYVLSLDADEALDEKLKKSILSIKSSLEYYSAYSFNRLTNYCGQWIKHCGWYPDKKIRLWDKTKGKWGGINPHDSVIMNVEKNQIYHLKGDLFHYSYYSVEEHRLQSIKFAQISAKADFERGKKTNLIVVWLKPIFKFFSDYFIRLGFLDGYYGFIICKISAHAKYLKYQFLRDFLNNKKRSSIS
jgi:glycosyltransferase involved in cell wall biosynthesis